MHRCTAGSLNVRGRARMLGVGPKQIPCSALSPAVAAARTSGITAAVWERMCLEPGCIDERRLLAPIRQALIEYRDTEESRPLTALVEQAVGETAGELLVHFGQAGMAGTVVF